METFSALLAICAGNSTVTGEFPAQGQWRGAMMFSLICALTNGSVNNHEANELRRHRAHYDVIVMYNCNADLRGWQHTSPFTAIKWTNYNGREMNYHRREMWVSQSITVTSHDWYSVPNNQQLHCWFNSFFRCTSRKTSKLRAIGLCEGNPPVAVRIPSQRVNILESVCMWWRHHEPISLIFNSRLVSSQL